MTVTLDGWTETAADTNGGGVTATRAAPASSSAVHVVTDVDYSGDAGTLVTVESPSGTVLWRKRYAATFSDSKTWPPGVMKGAAGQAVLIRVGTDPTANSEANISGYTRPW